MLSRWLLVLFEASLTTKQQTLPLTLFERFSYLPTTTWVYHVVTNRYPHISPSSHLLLGTLLIVYMWCPLDLLLNGFGFG